VSRGRAADGRGRVDRRGSRAGGGGGGPGRAGARAGTGRAAAGLPDQDAHAGTRHSSAAPRRQRAAAH
jgi:hypothetical protein